MKIARNNTIIWGVYITTNGEVCYRQANAHFETKAIAFRGEILVWQPETIKKFRKV